MISFVRCCTKKANYRFISYARTQQGKLARMLNKIVTKKIQKENIVNQTPKKLKKQILLSADVSEDDTRKMIALNKFYTEHLVELLNTGPYALELTELKIECSMVKLSPCLKYLNIYWASKKENSEAVLAEVLIKARKDLQSQIGLLKTMRTVPKIRFVRDVRMETEHCMKKLFEVADFGKDHKPYPSDVVIKSDMTEQLRMNLQKKQNMFGLDHLKIKDKIEERVRRFQAINVNFNESEKINKFEHTGKLVKFSKQLFNTFYKRKIFLDKKLRLREYNESFVTFEPYHYEKATEMYWNSLNFNDDFTIEEQDYRNFYDDEKGNDGNDNCIKDKDNNYSGEDTNEIKGEDEVKEKEGKELQTEKENKT